MTEPKRPNERVRREVALPAEDVKTFTSLVEAKRGATVATLAYGWVMDAARFAKTGRGSLLPRRSSIAHVESSRARVKWTQSPSEYARCVQLIEDAGSSVRAVLYWRMKQFVAAGG